MKKPPTIIIIRESLWESVTKDAASGAALVGAFWLNDRFIGSTALDVVLAIVALGWGLAICVSSAREREMTLDQAAAEIERLREKRS